MSSIKIIQQQIQNSLAKAHRSPSSVQLIAVSKKQPIEKIIQLRQAGHRDFGENYVQEWKNKHEKFSDIHDKSIANIRWHFIGHLQSNKAKEVVGKIDIIQSVDSIKLAKKISSLAEAQKLTQKILLQVNLGEEKNKSGFLEEELFSILPQIAKLRHLEVLGLMAIPPTVNHPEEARPYFKRLKSLLKQCNQQKILSKELTELSMGMSQDFEVAIEEGATMVRLGTALFGPRE